MPEKMHIDFTWTTASVCKTSYKLCVLKHGTPNLVTSNEKLKSRQTVSQVHCGLACGATLCTLRSGPTSKQ